MIVEIAKKIQKTASHIATDKQDADYARMGSQFSLETYKQLFLTRKFSELEETFEDTLV